MSLRSPAAALQALNLAALGGMTWYFKSHHDYNLQEHEARMDELEGTLRGHIGLIEESLERLEGKAKGRIGEDRDGKLGGKGEELYMARGRDEKAKR
ncbi:hypothetical protein LTR53_006872 [Teratosphaeriaceae sp. CCFEE 6253]|nr:hypothetical protein LTR53_006872 [Teratosphaeriaceae sp. CCFEE 6253]